MKVLFVHNSYRGEAAGEDVVVDQEMGLLRDRGHELQFYRRTNEETQGLSGALRFPVESIWSARSQQELARQVSDFGPDVAHVHNTWAVVSPSVFHALEGVPTVQTLHNYRWLCVNAQFRRDGRPCEKCKELDFPSWGIVHACYRNSRVASGILATSNYVARRSNALNRVDLFVALTDFARRKFVEAGFPPARVAVKPNFLAKVPADKIASNQIRDYVMYAGRLSTEKGVGILLKAWRGLDEIPLLVVGDGPLRNEVEQAAAGSSAVEYREWQPREQVFALLGRAAFAVLPSLTYEGLPMGIVEAFGCGRTVVGSRIGGIAEVVKEGQTGLLVPMGEPDALRDSVRSLWNNPTRAQKMGQNARQVFLEQYGPDAGYQNLIEIYERARETARRRSVSASE